MKALVLSYQNEREDARLLYDVVTRKVVSEKLFDPFTKYVPREFNLMGGNMPMDVEASSIEKYCLELLLTTHHLIPQELRENGDIHRAIQKAVELRKKDHLTDVTVLITGKGTDPYIMEANGKKTPWSDAKIAQEELEKVLMERQ